MSFEKQVVLVTGASGSMGFEAFKLLWEKKDRFEIVLLLRPSGKNRKLFRAYENNGLKIIWGDALIQADVEEACKGIDWCLHTMALISPEADRNPEMAYKVNVLATRYIVNAIQAQDPEHIKLVYIGSVAEYGDRLPPIHVGRAGDPLIPSVFDHYAISKMEAELTVMESSIIHKVSLRQTFIMIPGLFSLMDPIMFHQPINSFMENITSRDSGRLLVSCLNQQDDSDFWGGYYNISGGPACRTTYLEFLQRIYSMLGIDYRKAMERKWFALRNFHMQFFEDTHLLNSYMKHWEGGYSMEDFYEEVWQKLALYLKITSWLNRCFPPCRWIVQKITYGQLKRLANKPDGTLGWIRKGESGKIAAFYGSEEAFRNIPVWDIEMPSLDQHQEYKRLDHGYNESKENLEIEDLMKAAQFRGGSLVSDSWDGRMDSSLSWKCCQKHNFELSPRAVLKGGHWCMKCISPPVDYKVIAEKNRFAAQVINS